ncbi:MAG: hypothetical protein ABW079_06655 [Sedimenticola sp.]
MSHKRILKGCLIMMAFFVSNDAKAVYWWTPDYKDPNSAAAAYCQDYNGGWIFRSYIEIGIIRYGYYAAKFSCDTSGGMSLPQYIYRTCDNGQRGAEGECPEEQANCTEGQFTTHRIQSGNFHDFPASIDVDGCEYIAGHPDAPGEWECYLDPLGREWCQYPYGSTGEQSSDLPIADNTVPPLEEQTNNNESPPTTVTEQAAPVTETDIPETGDTTVTEQTTETTTKPAYKDITNTDTKTDIVDVTDENIVKTTTTKTTTKPDGTVIKETTVEYQQDPVTVTKTEIQWSTGQSSSTSNTYPGKSGSTTTTETKNPDGSSSTSVTTTGQGGQGDGTGTGTGSGVGPGEGEDKEEAEEKFTAPQFGDAKTYKESMQDFYTRAGNSPIGKATDSIANGMPSGGTCSQLSLDLYFGRVATDIHCTTWDAVKDGLSVVMIAAWSLLAVFIFFSA